MKAIKRRALQDRRRREDAQYTQSWLFGPKNMHWEMPAFLALAAGAAWMCDDWTYWLFVFLPIAVFVWLFRWWWNH